MGFSNRREEFGLLSGLLWSYWGAGFSGGGTNSLLSGVYIFPYGSVICSTEHLEGFYLKQ